MAALFKKIEATFPTDKLSHVVVKLECGHAIVVRKRDYERDRVKCLACEAEANRQAAIELNAEAARRAAAAVQAQAYQPQAVLQFRPQHSASAPLPWQQPQQVLQWGPSSTEEMRSLREAVVTLSEQVKALAVPKKKRGGGPLDSMTAQEARATLPFPTDLPQRSCTKCGRVGTPGIDFRWVFAPATSRQHSHWRPSSWCTVCNSRHFEHLDLKKRQKPAEGA